MCLAQGHFDVSVDLLKVDEVLTADNMSPCCAEWASNWDHMSAKMYISTFTTRIVRKSGITSAC